MAVRNAPNFSTCSSGVLTCQTETACPPNPAMPPANNLMNGCLYAKQNGFVNQGNQAVTMQAHGPDGVPSPVAGISPSYWVSFTVSEVLPQTFSAVLGRAFARVSTRSTAGVFQNANGACIYVLDPTGDAAFDAGGNPDVEASCGIFINSNSGDAMDVGGTKAVVNSTIIKIVGGYQTHGQPTINPIPTINAAVTPDPFRDVPLPVVPAGHGCDSGSGIPTNGPINMPPDGFYVVCSGGFQMSGNPDMTLPAGIYVLKDGSIDLHNGTLRGDGVTFYLTGSFSGVTINGNVDLQLSAPTSGPTKGLIFFQDRTLPVGAFSSKINGTSNTIFNGSLYFPTTEVEYSGGADTTATYTAIVAWDIAFKGNSYFAADPNGAHTGLGVPTVAIIE